MWTKAFWQDAIERAVKTFFQAYAAAWVAVSSVQGGGPSYDTLFTLDNVKAGIVGVALSVFMSLGSTFKGDKQSASLVE